MPLKPTSSILLALSAALFAPFAQAHTGSTEPGMLAGFLHPLSGLDHLLAALAAGLWVAAAPGRPGVHRLIAIFPGMLLLGALAGLGGLALPAAEGVGALSVLVFGVGIALALRIPLLSACVLTGAFAFYHGYLHVMALPQLTASAGYLGGLVLMTATLFGSGILLHQLLRSVRTGLFCRVCGYLLAFTGSALLVSA